MKSYILNLEKEFSLIENGFKEQEKRALADYKAKGAAHCKELARLAYSSEVYQVRMYAVFLFGHLSDSEEILTFMRDEISKDENWRVQEVLAKAFDEFCKKIGYEQALLTIDEWLKNGNANAKRAVSEGLRIWTNRPYFKDNPSEAIRRLASLKGDESEYLRKSVGNAIKDISKKFPNLVKTELDSWDLDSKEAMQTYKFASKFIKK
ncbi:DNA alkylation repair protein [Campylobacter concisus]|uniref:DNA glycosylase, predicted DNA alkylation repair enzyme n=1 Tax=Campylobacter concisus (strain 13826) TaxID=360104 RepID=A7ZAX8_CAMC1|nr:DNA alkylation repair protein [Campylobacter concisus]EAT99152.1 DNA glycosylase, predicted DNA alkylation repair enzyme [Campylobacter concisus 13826]MBS5809884.1 DNA alkylation repair protein [Campylobacter concisus]